MYLHHEGANSLKCKISTYIVDVYLFQKQKDKNSVVWISTFSGMCDIYQMMAKPTYYQATPMHAHGDIQINKYCCT